MNSKVINACDYLADALFKSASSFTLEERDLVRALKPVIDGLVYAWELIAKGE